ncbi:dihydrofolate reductase [Candidatus Roizmanbacteria bacterium]|nr:dihydrofolate reductase [Candidatus Roizmanbacteria bacterium]
MVSAIAALAVKNRVIGNRGKIPWHIPEDIKRFRDMTKGHAVIMGRKTYESIGRPLPDRTNIVVTRDPAYKAEGCIVVTTIDDALERAREFEKEEVFIIGGGEIYKVAFPKTDRLYLTLVEGDYEGDAYFPDYSEFKKVISEERRQAGGYTYAFVTLKR